MTWAQPAWQLICHQRLNVRLIYTSNSQNIQGYKDKYSNPFYTWLVGFTDGDGTFTIDRQKDGTKWNLVYKISQDKANLRILYYIKSKLGIGKITVPKDGNCYLRVRDLDHQIEFIFPIFDKIPLVTVKYYDFILVKEAAGILGNPKQSTKDKNLKMEYIFLLLQKGPDKGYKSIIWNNVDCNNITRDQIHILAFQWLIGFWEVKGSFYIVHKGKGRYVHGMGQSQKEDRHILEIIRLIFQAKAKVKDNRPRANNFAWDSTSQDVIRNAISYFRGHQIGRQSLRYSIWSKSVGYKGLKQVRAMNLQDKV